MVSFGNDVWPYIIGRLVGMVIGECCTSASALSVNTTRYRAKWTDAIHDEWTRNVLKARQDLKPEQLQRTRD